MAEGVLGKVFLAHLPATCAFDRSDPTLEDELRARLEAGRAAWVGVDLPDVAFVRHLAEHSANGGLPARERAAELYIACACAEGARGAVAAFYAAFRAEIEHAAARVDPSPAFLDDAVQAVSERILMPADGARPRIAEYAGRASLRGWLGAVGKRVALSLRRKKDEQAKATLSSAAHALGADVGPERHGVSRATVARRLAAAREALHDETRRRLTEQLRLTPSELASVAALVRSQLDVSLAGVVRADAKRP